MDERLKPYEEKMQKSYDFLEGDLATIRAGRANPHVLDKVRVDYYGTPTPIQQVSNVTVPEPRIIQIAPWEKSLIKAIENNANIDAEKLAEALGKQQISAKELLNRRLLRGCMFTILGVAFSIIALTFFCCT